MSEKLLTISQIYAKGKEKLKERGIDWVYPTGGGRVVPAVSGNHRYLGSLFFETKFFDPVEVDTSITLFGVKLKTPIFCSPISRSVQVSDAGLAEIAKGIADAGALMMLGIGGSNELQSAIDTGAPVVKMVKPYRRTELIYEKVRDAESLGCVAVGIDIDHFYGTLGASGAFGRTELFAPQRTEELQQVVSETKLPFIFKGVLSVTDAEKAVRLGASAIVVSNHGSGSQEFSVPSMIALPKIVDTVGGKVTVLIDTGFETGGDILKALAFGAKAVGFGSSMILAWAADGAKGVELLVNQLTAELRRTMAATGCPSPAAIDRSIIVPLPFTYPPA